MTNFLQRTTERYKGTLTFFLGSAATLYGLAKYAQHTWSSFRQDLELEQASKANIKRRFEQNQNDCLYAIASLFPAVSEKLTDQANVDNITSQLKQLRKTQNEIEQQINSLTEELENSENEKVDNIKDSIKHLMIQKTESKSQQQVLFSELKIYSFTRAVASIYILALISLFSHLQLNLLGRFLYVDSIVKISEKESESIYDNRNSNNESDIDTKEGDVSKIDSPFHTDDTSISVDTERLYLTFSWYLVNNGVSKLIERIKHATELAVEGVSVNNPTSYEDIIEILEKTRDEVEINDSVTSSKDESEVMYNFASLLVPNEEFDIETLESYGEIVADEIYFINSSGKKELVKDTQLHKLLDETRDLLECSDFNRVLSSILDDMFDLLYNDLKPIFFATSEQPAPSKSQLMKVEVNDNKSLSDVQVLVPFAKLFPIISRQARGILSSDTSNAYLNLLLSQSELRAFSTIVYTGWDSVCL